MKSVFYSHEILLKVNWNLIFDYLKKSWKFVHKPMRNSVRTGAQPQEVYKKQV